MALRTKPVILEASVPTAMALLERSRLEPAAAGAPAGRSWSARPPGPGAGLAAAGGAARPTPAALADRAFSMVRAILALISAAVLSSSRPGGANGRGRVRPGLPGCVAV